MRVETVTSLKSVLVSFPPDFGPGRASLSGRGVEFTQTILDTRQRRGRTFVNTNKRRDDEILASHHNLRRVQSFGSI